MISVKADIAEAQEALSGTSKSLAAIERKTLSIIAKGTVKAVKGGIRQTLKSRTGQLLKAFRYKVHKNGVANVYPDGESGNERLTNRIRLFRWASFTPLLVRTCRMYAK